MKLKNPLAKPTVDSICGVLKDTLNKLEDLRKRELKAEQETLNLIDALETQAQAHAAEAKRADRVASNLQALLS